MRMCLPKGKHVSVHSTSRCGEATVDQVLSYQPEACLPQAASGGNRCDKYEHAVRRQAVAGWEALGRMGK